LDVRFCFFFFQAEDGIRDLTVTGVQTCALPIFATLAPALAAQGVQYHPALLRPASFIESAIAKLRNSLLVGAVLVVALLLVTLRDWRGALISFSSIPVSLLDRKSTRLNSSHSQISYAVFCLKKKKIQNSAHLWPPHTRETELPLLV